MPKVERATFEIHRPRASVSIASSHFFLFYLGRRLQAGITLHSCVSSLAAILFTGMYFEPSQEPQLSAANFFAL